MYLLVALVAHHFVGYGDVARDPQNLTSLVTELDRLIKSGHIIVLSLIHI